jgi:hypothetical protein
MGDPEKKDCKVSIIERNDKYPWVKEMTDDGLQLSYSKRNESDYMLKE